MFIKRKILHIIIIFLFFLIIGWLITQFTVKDRGSINSALRACAMRDTHQILRNPIERTIIVKTVVEKNRGRTVYTGSYTLFGIKYGEVKTVCDARTQVIWRRCFNVSGTK